MGASTSKQYHHSTNDYELAIKASKELEYILETEFHATGRGLHEKITSASSSQQQSGIPPHLIKQMRYLATIRNKLIHERGFDSIPDRELYIAKFERSAKELESIIIERNKNRKSGGASGSSACVIC